MKKIKVDDKIISILLFCFILVYLIIYRFIILKDYLKYEEFITTSFFIILTVVSMIVLGFRINKIEKINDSKIITLITMLLLYFSLIYCIGFFKGFLQNSYSLRVEHVFLNIICPLVNIISLEVLRYILMWSNKKNKSFYVICLITFTFIEVILGFNFYDLGTIDGIFELICLLIVKSMMDNFLLCYMTLNIGLKSCIIYKLSISLYLYLITIITDLGMLLETFINVLFPFIMWILFSRIIALEEDNIVVVVNDRKSNNLLFYILMVILIIMSGITPLKFMTIASPSMEPAIKVGDAVLINSMFTNIEKNDIIAFRHEGRVIVHRIYDISSEGNCIQTKGDFNQEIDNFVISEEDIIGKLLINVPYLGYPALYFSKLLGGS